MTIEVIISQSFKNQQIMNELHLFTDIAIDDLENDCLHISKDKYNCSSLFYYRLLYETILCVQKKFIHLFFKIFNSQDNN